MMFHIVITHKNGVIVFIVGYGGLGGAGTLGGLGGVGGIPGGGAGSPLGTGGILFHNINIVF